MGVRGLFLGGLLGLLLAPPAQADDWIYVQRENGVRSFSDMKPASGSYTRIPRHGRQTATASCTGLTEHGMQQRAAMYAPIIQKVSARHGLEPRLVSAVIRVESCYDKKAVSRSGARGLMQLMPATARDLGVHDSFDPHQNIDGGVRYLAKMFQRFDNDLRLSLAAYNAGPETVEAFRDVPPYPDTQSYVTRILKHYHKAKT
ncbi:MAG: lytic transglycosylase domain-containing protein [Gammaproteobacteria bacterium]